jgi:hypothetical protein
MAGKGSSESGRKSSGGSSEDLRLNPDDVGLSKEEEDQIMADLDDLTEEDIKKAGEVDQ